MPFYKEADEIFQQVKRWQFPACQIAAAQFGKEVKIIAYEGEPFTDARNQPAYVSIGNVLIWREVAKLSGK